MKRTWKLYSILGALTLTAGLVGCGQNVPVAPPAPLGSLSDAIFKDQEENAEASKYVVYAHEFELNKAEADGTNKGGWKLNEYGQDHLRQIAVNIKKGHSYPIVLERSQTSSKPGTKFGYPVHFNDELDRKRRDVVVASLVALGVDDAESLVIVAPAFAEGYTGGEAARAYQRGLNSNAGSRGGFGGIGGGFGGGFGGGIF